MNKNLRERRGFARVIGRMTVLSFQSSPRAFFLFIATSLLFTLLLVADIHLIRTLLNKLPLFVEGKIYYRTVLLTVLLLGGVNVIDTLMNGSLNLLYEYLQKTSSARMTEVMSKKASKLDLIRFESAELYDSIEKASLGRDRGFEAMEGVIFSLIFHGGYFLFLALYLAWIEPVLILGIFACFLPVALSRYVRGSAFYKTENKMASVRREFSNYEMYLTDREFFKETRSSGATAFFRSLYDQALKNYNREMWRTEVRTGVIDLCLKVLTLLGYTGLLLLLVQLLLRSRITPGMFGAVYFAMANIFKWFEELFSRLGAAYENAAIGSNYFAFLDLPEMRGGNGILRRDQGITVENVSFRYPGTDSAAVDRVSLVIPPGQSVALVGENGSGKSTLVRLLAGLYLPESGRVLIGDVDTREASNCSRFDGVSAVFQSYQRYHMTVRDNVSIGDPAIDSAPTARVKAVLADAGLNVEPSVMLSREFGGTDLSGGEWQRVAIARGLYRKHEMIFLDEPTAAIEPLEETALYRRFADVVDNKTAILVTHRMGSARIADRIVVLDGGRIVEDGTHEQLLNLRGKYAQMFESQARWYNQNP